MRDSSVQQTLNYSRLPQTVVLERLEPKYNAISSRSLFWAIAIIHVWREVLR